MEGYSPFSALESSYLRTPAAMSVSLCGGNESSVTPQRHRPAQRPEIHRQCSGHEVYRGFEVVNHRETGQEKNTVKPRQCEHLPRLNRAILVVFEMAILPVPPGDTIIVVQ
jgi:hypothetical protein